MGKTGKERKRRKLEAAKLPTPPLDGEDELNFDADFLLGLVSRTQLQTTVHTLSVLSKHQADLKDSKSDLRPLRAALHDYVRIAQATSGEGDQDGFSERCSHDHSTDAYSQACL